MILLIAIILIFIILSLLNFFQPKGSFYYYTNLVAMAQGACTASQSATNTQFNSNPSAIVFQIYDNATCDKNITSNYMNIFSLTSPYDSSSLKNNYDICYAQQGSAQNPNQYFYSSGITPTVYTFKVGQPYTSGAVNYLTAYQQLNNLGVPAVQVNASMNDQTDTNLNLTQYGGGTFTFTPGGGFSFTFTYYANVSSTINLFFGENCQQGPYTFSASNKQPIKLSIGNACSSSFKSVSLQVQPNVVTPGQQPAIGYQFNLTAVSSTSQTNAINTVLFQQCMGMGPEATNNEIVSGTVVCDPIKCGSTSFILADTQDRPFLALLSETYPFFGMQPALAYLQIIDPNSQLNVNSPVIHR